MNANSVKNLLDTAEEEINKKYTTKEELEEAYAKVVVMSQTFDHALDTMRIAANDYNEGVITKKDFYEVIRTQKKLLKEPSQLLMVHLGKEFNKEDELTMEDATAFRDYARGLYRIFKKKLKEASDIEMNPTLADKIEEAYMSSYSYGREMKNDIAMESYIDDDIYPDHDDKEIHAFGLICESLKINPDMKDKIKKNLSKAKSINTELWGEDENHNVLYITGYSGSGKSTVTEELKDSNTIVIHLDLYFDEYYNPNAGGKSSIFTDFLKKKNIPIPNTIDENEWDSKKVLSKFDNAIEEFGKYQFKLGKKVIVEGVQIADDTIQEDKSFFQDKCLIVLQTSQLKSRMNANKRDQKKVGKAMVDMVSKHKEEAYARKQMRHLEKESGVKPNQIDIV